MDDYGAAQQEMLYCNTCREARIMPTPLHPQHHRHPAGQGHPPATIAPSILRMSVVERLAIATVLIAVLWGIVLWAMKA